MTVQPPAVVLLGYVAASLTTLSFIPQAIKRRAPAIPPAFRCACMPCSAPVWLFGVFMAC